MSGPQPDEPNYFVLIAPGADSNDPTPSWVDVSTDLRHVSVNRGADKHLDEDQPGEATIVLDNYQGDYDNDNTGSPYAGQLVTDMRVRVLAEWDGELYERFNGYLDDIELEYPEGDAEAWAVLRCTDAFKVLAGAQLPSSPYVIEVIADNPVSWWRFGEPEGATTAFDSAGTRPGTYSGTLTLDEASLISREADAAVLTTDGGTGQMMAIGAAPDTGVFSIEWIIRISTMPAGTRQLWVARNSSAETMSATVNFAGSLQILAGGALLQATGADALVVNTTYHIVVTGDATDSRLYINGILKDTDVAFTAPAAADFYPLGQTLNTTAATHDDVAIYNSKLSAARVAAHAEAVTTPWNGDIPSQRAHRICDVIGWPDVLRDFEEGLGMTTLQSADLGGTTALDHLLKVAASEFGELHVSKEGAIKLVARHSLINRDQLADFGPAADEVRYRAVRFGSGADLVRNPVTVSRAEGVAQTVEAARTYYPHHFTLDGLIHDSDELSLSAANFLLSEFKDQKRRISGLTFGPFDAERLFDWFPLLLEAELGDVYQVTFSPPNGDDLVQVSVLEGTRESWSADTGIGEISWSLSRAYAGGSSFWQLGVHGRSELGETTRLYF